MSNKQKLKRITDLFTEGTVCFLGDDESDAPVCVWVQKNNSLEDVESRLDAQAARTRMMVELSDITHPALQHAQMIMDDWDDDELFQAANNQNSEKCFSQALLEIEGAEEWQEKLEYLRREPSLLDDAKVAEDDPRRAQYSKVNDEYLAAVQELANKKMEEALSDVKNKGRADVEAEFIKGYKDRLALEQYMSEARVTKLFYAVRDCDAKLVSGEWDHSDCDHSVRLFDKRTEVKELPEDVLTKIITTFDNLAVGARNVANFPETTNSSD